MILFAISFYFCLSFFVAGVTVAFSISKINSNLDLMYLLLVAILFGPIIWLTTAIKDYFKK